MDPNPETSRAIEEVDVLASKEYRNHLTQR